LLVDEFWDLNNKQYGRADGDKNTYRNGRIGAHSVVLMVLPNMGTAAVAGSAASLRTSYPALRIAFLVGVCGGSPAILQAFLGDVVISEGVVQYLFGKQYPGGFVTRSAIEGNVHVTNREIRSLINYLRTEPGRRDLQENSAHHLKVLQELSVAKQYKSSYKYPGLAEDKLFEAEYPHKHRGQPVCDLCCGENEVCDEAAQTSCSDLECDESHLVARAPSDSSEFRALERMKAQGPDIFIGRVGSGDAVMKSAEHRDKIAKQHNIIGFEMEGAGLWSELPSIVIKGVCDYSDSHKNKLWQPYAAATAAAVTKAVLGLYSLNDDIESTSVTAGKC
jgi:nucleoside phosphorylase